MFYSTQILAKKGPLGTIWIAAHLDRRLKRHQVFEANIAISVGAFLDSLRLLGRCHLRPSLTERTSRTRGIMSLECARIAFPREIIFQDVSIALSSLSWLWDSLIAQSLHKHHLCRYDHQSRSAAGPQAVGAAAAGCCQGVLEESGLPLPGLQ